MLVASILFFSHCVNFHIIDKPYHLRFIWVLPKDSCNLDDLDHFFFSHLSFLPAKWFHVGQIRNFVVFLELNFATTAKYNLIDFYPNITEPDDVIKIQKAYLQLQIFYPCSATLR